jgi:hypothetical protein
MPVILAFRRLRQDGHEFKTRQGCITKPCLKTTKKSAVIRMERRK